MGGTTALMILSALGYWTLSAAGAHQFALESVFFVTIASIVVGALLARLIEKRLTCAGMLVTLLGVAYLPSSWDALASGFPRSPIRVSSLAVLVALAAWFAQVLLTAGSAFFAARTRALSVFAGSCVRVIAPDGERSRVFFHAFAALFIVVFVSALFTGRWTYYAGGASTVATHEAGGFHLGMLYPNALIAMVAIVSGELFNSTGNTGIRRTGWIVVALSVGALLFVFQSRRLMIAGLLLVVLPVFRQNRVRLGRPKGRIVLLVVGAVLAASFLQYGSVLWRRAVSRSHVHSASQIVEEMLRDEATAEEAVENVRERLSYLWIDSVAMDEAVRGGRDMLGEVAAGQAIRAIPGALFPDKYAFNARALTCEDAMRGRSIPLDLACTPICEGAFFGGGPGVFIVLMAWAAVVGLAAAFESTQTLPGRAVAALLVSPLALIESAAFPAFAALRVTIIIIGLAVPGAWVLSMLRRLRFSDSHAVRLRRR